MPQPLHFHHAEEIHGDWPHRPVIRGTRHMAIAGHYLAAHAAFAVLEAGGNAIDAGVAGGITEAVVESDQVNFAGVAPILIYLADRREVVTISGLGTWPLATSLELFEREYAGSIPEGLLRTVVPAAPAAWIEALEKFGTMTFGEVSGAALRFARDGYPIHHFTAAEIAKRADHYRRWPHNAEIYLPNGEMPRSGELFKQSDLGRTLQYLVDEEASASGKGRIAGLQAVRDAFYLGDIATTIVDYHRQNGGLLSAEDMANFQVEIEPPVRTTFRGIEVYTCGFWSQGPILLQTLNLLEGYDLAGLGHNSAAYIHTLVEALKLCFADRHHYYGDPRFVEVPESGLLSAEYAACRRGLIRNDWAFPEMPTAGDPSRPAALANPCDPPEPTLIPSSPGPDTSYVCTTDKWGNLFSVSPSDPSYDMQVIPGTGICPSSRGTQSWVDPDSPSCVAPGKRPRLTPMPALALKNGCPVYAFGTPGGDVQPQAMLQSFLNSVIFGMNPQSAVEAPRFVTRSFPDSFTPHNYYPGLLNLEGRIERQTGDALAALGHRIEWWPDRTSRSGGMCLLEIDVEQGILQAGADYRRAAYALGW